jgi:hypothetical protein
VTSAAVAAFAASGCTSKLPSALAIAPIMPRLKFGTLP